MFVEERTYTLAPGRTAEYLDWYERLGMGVQREILGRNIGFFSTEFGGLNQIVHLWGYESLDERSERRARLYRDPRWLDYLRKAPETVRQMENRLLIPAPFSPIR